MWFFIYSAVLFVIVWLGTGIAVSFKTNQFQLTGFKFSRKLYYLFLSIFLVAALLEAISFYDVNAFLDFIIFMFAGILGETVFSFWWRTFFAKPIWSYKADTFGGEISSMLNFIPWGVSGKFAVMIWSAYRQFTGSGVDLSIFLLLWLLFIVFFLVQLVLELVMKLFSKKTLASSTHRELSIYIYFTLPITVALILLTFALGLNFFFLTVAFGVVYFVSEFLFGYFIFLLSGKKLWQYNFMPVNGGLSSIYAIIPFCFAGFYFTTIWLIVNSF